MNCSDLRLIRTIRGPEGSAEPWRGGRFLAGRFRGTCARERQWPRRLMFPELVSRLKVEGLLLPLLDAED